MVWPAIAAAGIGAAANYLGSEQQRKAARQNRSDQNQLTEEWRQLHMPELTPIEFEQFKDTFTPQMAQDSLMGNIETDSRLSGAQYAALDQLGELSQGGLNLQDKADLADIHGSVARQDAGRQAAIMQGMAERGMGGSGMELAQKLQSQSAGADRAAGNSRSVAAQAQQRALDAIMRRGQLGGEMREQQFGEDSAKARAQDAMNLYNTGLLNEGQRNTQNISNMNTGVSHRNAGQANEVAQQNFNNERSKLEGITGRVTASGGHNTDMGNINSKMIGDLGSGAAKAFGSYMSNQSSDPVAGASLTYAGPPQQSDADKVNRKRERWK